MHDSGYRRTVRGAVVAMAAGARRSSSWPLGARPDGVVDRSPGAGRRARRRHDRAGVVRAWADAPGGVRIIADAWLLVRLRGDRLLNGLSARLFENLAQQRGATLSESAMEFV